MSHDVLLPSKAINVQINWNVLPKPHTQCESTPDINRRSWEWIPGQLKAAIWLASEQQKIDKGCQGMSTCFELVSQEGGRAGSRKPDSVPHLRAEPELDSSLYYTIYTYFWSTIRQKSTAIKRHLVIKIVERCWVKVNATTAPRGGSGVWQMPRGAGVPGSCLPWQITNFAYCLSSLAFSLMAVPLPLWPISHFGAGWVWPETTTTAWCVATLQDEWPRHSCCHYSASQSTPHHPASENLGWRKLRTRHRAAIFI